jgi:hypothetical protein
MIEEILRSKFEKTYQYEDLLKEHSLDEYGVWKVEGEDKQTSIGVRNGLRHIPVLGYFEGNLKDIIDYSVNLPGFWWWGSGGRISKIKVTKIDEFATKKKQ